MLKDFVEKIKLNIKDEDLKKYLKKLYNINEVVKRVCNKNEINENTYFYKDELLNFLFEIICPYIEYFSALEIIKKLDNFDSLKSLYKLLCYNGVICNELFEEIFPNLYSNIAIFIEDSLKNKVCTICIENPDLYGSEFYIACNNCPVSKLIHIYNLFRPRDFNDLEKIADKLKTNLQLCIEDEFFSGEKRNMFIGYMKEINEYLEDM